MRFTFRLKFAAAGALALLFASGAAAQLLSQVPAAGPVLDGIGRVGADAARSAIRAADGLGASARSLAGARAERLRGIVAAHPDILEMTDAGPAVRGEIIAVDPSAEVLAAARDAGFTVTGDEQIEGLGIRSVTLEAPRGLSLPRALRRLRRLAPDAEFTANHLHGQSGSASPAPFTAAALAMQSGGGGPSIGIIDGGVAAHATLGGAIEQRGFVRGAPAPSAHGTAIASLLAGRGAVRGAAPGARLVVADIYGRDPAGGNSVALARALGWMAERRVPVVAVSLVGPSNPLVQRAVAAALARGVHVVAAVGNDGPAAPPAFPASYPGVIAVTGVDARNRALIEAGRSLHLDYAAPGADMVAAAPGGGVTPVRGTSYAVPFVAARASRALAAGRPVVATLDAEAVDLAPRGPDRRHGRGLVCATCRTAR
jgi:minor extracellular protease Epr